MEHILQYILPSILGDFIQGIDKNHMKTNLLSGKVTLQGVSLNPAILKMLNLPTKILYSTIGKFEVKIPWLQRLKQPIEVYLEDLFVILEPVSTLDDFDIVAERVKFLEMLTKECRNQLRNLNQDAQKEGGSMDYYKVLILDNMQVTIKNIHIRFENQKKGYAFGSTLDEVNICTINEKGQTEFLDRTLEENKTRDLYKRLLIQDISLYWNSAEDQASFMGNSSKTDDQKKTFLKDKILRRGQKDQGIQPILFISLESNLVFKNLNKADHEKEPRYRLEIDLKPINVNLDNNQVNQVVSLVDYFTMLTRTRKRKHKLPQIAEEDRENEAILYQKALTDFLLTIEDPEFKLADELANPKRKAEADQISEHLARIPNDTVTAISKETILKDEKRRLLLNMEKKMNKKGFLGLWGGGNQDGKRENEELSKIESFFDAFIQENREKIGKNIMKGFILQVDLKLSEASILLLNAKSATQQGVLAMIKNTKIKFEFHKHEEYDVTKLDFSLQDLKMSLKKKNVKDNTHKEIMILTKFNTYDVSDLAGLSIQMKTALEGRGTINFEGKIRGTELRFIPELVVTLKKFFKFDRIIDDDNFADYAYEKMADLSKNAQDQLKTLINDYSSTVSISLEWESIHLLLPLNMNTGKESDCWLVAVEGTKIYTDPENTEMNNKEDIIYNKLKYGLKNINIKYIEKIQIYEDHRKGSLDKEAAAKMITPFMDDTQITLELSILRRIVKDKLYDDPEVMVNFNIGDISVNVNPLLYKKLYEIKNCFDFSREKDLNEYLETEKNMILKKSDGLFKVYFRDYYEITSAWTEYIMVCSGFYLYFFRSHDDVQASRYVFTKRAKVKVEDEAYDFPNILKITNRFEEVVIAFDNEASLKRLVNIIKKKNDEYAENNLAVTVGENEVEKKAEESVEKPLDNYQKILFKFMVMFEGLTLNLSEQSGTKVNKISLWKLGIEYTYRSLDQFLKVQLTDVSVADYTINPDSDQTMLILASRTDLLDSTSRSNDLIIINLKMLDNKHPEFEKNLNEKEISILFNTLFINYIPARIYFLIHFFLDPIPLINMEDSSSPAPPERSTRKATTDITPSDAGIKNIHYIAKKAENKQEVKFLTGEIRVNQLSLILFSLKTHLKIAEASLQHLVVDMNVDKNLAAYKGSLQNIQVFDLTNYQQDMDDPEINPYELIGIEKGLSVLEFEFIQRDEAYMRRLKSDVANLISFNVNSIRLNYVNQPALRIMNYITNFMLDFGFAETYTYEEKIFQAVSRIRNPTFLSVNVVFNNPRILMRAKPASKVYFELDLDLLTITNETVQSTKRLLQAIPSLDFVYGECYKISTSEIRFTKKMDGGESLQLSNLFKLDVTFERCLWYDEYILATNVSQDEKFSTLDNGFYIAGTVTPVFLKFNQEDYLDIMDAIFMNLAFDDMRDPQYHIDLEAIPEMKHMNIPTPINLEIMMEHIIGLAMDQMMNNPLARISALPTRIGFTRDRQSNKNVQVSINKLITNYFEKDVYDENVYIEKTLLGQIYYEKEMYLKTEYTVDEIFDPEVIMQERDELEKVKETLIKLEYKMHASQDRDLILSIQQLKLILNLEVLLRLKDFFMLSGESDDNDQQMQRDLDYKSKSQYRISIEKAEISIPVSEESTVIIKGAILFDWVKYDITNIVLKKNNFLESSMINLNLIKNEIFVFYQHPRNDEAQPYLKRSIIFPFSLMWKSKEHMTYEKTNNALLTKYENTYIVDKIVLRVSSTDSIVALSASKFLGQEFERYRALIPFPLESKNTLPKISTSKKINLNMSKVQIMSEKHKAIHDGVQLRFINDLSGVSIPLLEVSLHSSRDNSSINFEKSIHLLQGKNCLEISSSFYNSKVGKWEPILEKWGFILEIDFGLYQEFRKRLDIVNNNQEVLNINISDEMLKVLLLTWKDWDESFNQFTVDSRKFTTAALTPIAPPKVDSLSISTASKTSLASSQKMSALLSTDDINDVEYVSPFTIWNDTGYPLHVDPFIIGTAMRGITCKKKLDLAPGDQQDLLMEWNIDRIFEASTKESVLERMKVSVWLEHPVYGTVSIPQIDIHNFGTKKRKLEFKLMKKEFPIICNVFNYKKKKLVRFSSPMVIKNSLPKLVIVQIYDEGGTTSSMLEIPSNTSSALPFDKVRNYISFHIDKVSESSQNQVFKADSLMHNAPAGVALGTNYTLIRSQLYRAYATVFLEPLIIIKNCLPFALHLDLVGKRGSHMKSIRHTLEAQEDFQVTDFSPEYKVKLKCTTEGFTTNEFTLLPNDKSSPQPLYFYFQNKKVQLNIFIPTSKADLTLRVFISAKACVLNESTENLQFFASNESTSWVSPFSIMAPDDNEIVIFDSITAMKVRPKSEGSSTSEFISLNRLGVVTIDICDGQKQILNLGIQVTNVLCDRQNNIFTKIIRVLPRYIVCNKTKHQVSFFQSEAVDKAITLKPDERSSFHFSKGTKDKHMKLKLLSSDGKPTDWRDSGILDVSSPGNLDFILQNQDYKEDVYFNLLIKIQDASLFITLQQQDSADSSIQIKNNIEEYDLIIHQETVANNEYRIVPHEKIPFGWVQPCRNNVIVAKIANKKEVSSEITCNLNDINKPVTEVVMLGTGATTISYYVTLHGRARVIKFYTGKDVKENKDEEFNFLFRACVPSLGISLISAASSRKYELAYISITPFMFVVVDKNDATTLQLRIKSIVIDNNIRYDVLHPVTLLPQNLKQLRERDLPYLDFICKVKNRHKPSDILYLKDLQFYLAETNIHLDAHTLNAISDFIRSINKVLKQAVYAGVESYQYLFLSEKEKKSLFRSRQNNNNVCLSWQTIDPIASTTDFMYIEKLAIQPILINLTFKNLQFEKNDSFIFALLKNSLGKALANFDRAPIKLKGIGLTSVYGTKDQVIGTISQRYKDLAKETVMGIILSSNIIGNPVKFFDKISTGFNDLVDKPVQGFLEGPIEGGIGIIAGAGSFAAKTVGATFNSLHSITDSLANGLSTLSGDTDYISKRERANIKSNSNALTGSVQAVKSVGKGFLGGITGLFEKPIEGGVKDGVEGFMKGMLVGAKGLVIKPVTGVLDGVSKLTQGVSNTFDEDPTQKMNKGRISRVFYGKERIFKSYDIYHSTLMDFLLKKKPKKYINLTLLGAIFLDMPSNQSFSFSFCLLITLERLFFISFQKKNIVWKIKSTNIGEIFTADEGVKIMLKKPSKSVQNRVVLIPCTTYEKKAEVYTLLGILFELVEESLP